MMVRWKRVIVASMLSAIVALAALSGPLSKAEAVTYNLADHWSDSSNPNGPWSYRDGAGPITTHQDDWASGFATDQPAWAAAASGPGHIVSWFKSVNTAFDFVSGDVITHTWDSENGLTGRAPSWLVWTSPFNAEIDINGDVWLARHIGRNVSVDLFINGVATGFSDSSLADTTRINRDMFALSNIVLSSGSTVALRFITTSVHGEFVGVNLSIDATPTTAPVPEPATLLLLGSGLAGLGWFGRKRRKDHDREA